MRVLIVEDDIVIASELERILRKNGYYPDVAGDGKTGLSFALQHPYKAILLDIMLPEMDGIEVCQSLRRAGIDVPILMITARDAIDDRVKGLDTGADDYLVKPFAAPELLARIRALTRRDAANKSEVIQFHDLIIDGQAHTASRAGKDLHLTRREFSLLEALARRPGQVLTREAILERIWNNEESLPNTVNFHVSSLRKKVDQSHDQKLIYTVHGSGYVLRSPEE